MDDQPCSSASANYFIPKTEKWQTTPFANNSGRAAAHNVIRQSPGPTRLAKSQCSRRCDTLFLPPSFRKNICQWTNHGATVSSSSWKPVDDEGFKVFLGVVILIGVGYVSPITKTLHSYGAHLMAGLFSIALWIEEGINKFYAFSNSTMHSQDDIIDPLTSCNQSEKCLKLGTLTCVIPTPADQAWQGIVL